jgi:hypothetical protein
MLLDPVFIRLPKIGRATPGTWMQFTTGSKKPLERIVFRSSAIA